MLSFTRAKLSEDNGVLSLSVSLFNRLSNRSYTFRCQLECNEPMKTVGGQPFERPLEQPSRAAIAAVSER
ncbi:hypothetical protein NBH19_00585 [Rhizobium sp. S95]|uniref:Uncharacterized protein n=1 Tax=Ciceribacter sichuanensis TaxID=2949647 RepID=A0AAJ1BYQ0_9HYPH|nr:MULTISPECIES: hypothetical protein [unclassified Ciceribacter]MCM2394571.1 hypothetical protein [Ciceribacter sp. S95]MCO5958722.1 hypothetical protein [Ciceribacter sp. S101]